MRRTRIILAAVVVFTLLASTALAGQDWEFSSRHQALADTGNAVFNLRGLSPTLENIACLVGSPNFNILFEGNTNTVNTITSDNDDDYYMRYISGSMGLKTTYPTLQRDDDFDFAERLAFAFVPGMYAQNLLNQISYTDEDTETTENITRIQTFQRFGVAYGINEYVAIGVGFTLVPPTIITVSHEGDDQRGLDTKDNYTMWAPLMFSPELGVLVRPVEFIQLGLAYENGDLKSRRSEISHEYADGDRDVTTEAIAARSPNLGFGFGILVPDIENFMVGFDFDVQWRRGEASDYGYYADNQAIEWSVSVEKMWEIASIKGGLGYVDEVGTRRYNPYDAFFMAFGTDLYFDEHVMMGLSFRAETGYMLSDPGGPAFGGGLAWTFGGTF